MHKPPCCCRCFLRMVGHDILIEKAAGKEEGGVGPKSPRLFTTEGDGELDSRLHARTRQR